MKKLFVGLCLSIAGCNGAYAQNATKDVLCINKAFMQKTLDEHGFKPIMSFENEYRHIVTVLANDKEIIITEVSLTATTACVLTVGNKPKEI